MTLRMIALAAATIGAASVATPLLAQTLATAAKPTVPRASAALPETPAPDGPVRSFQDQARTVSPAEARQLVPPPARTAPSQE